MRRDIMTKQNFNYYIRKWHTIETSDDEIMVYDYNDYFMDFIEMHIKETDIYNHYNNQLEMERDNNMIIAGGFYPEHIKQIIFDMVQIHHTTLISVGDYDIRPDIYGVYEIQLFVEIMQSANNDPITLQFYFGDPVDKIKAVNNIFEVDC